jgi:hypothetical protein
MDRRMTGSAPVPDEYAMEGIEEILTASLTMCTMHTEPPGGVRRRSTEYASSKFLERA